MYALINKKYRNIIRLSATIIENPNTVEYDVAEIEGFEAGDEIINYITVNEIDSNGQVVSYGYMKNNQIGEQMTAQIVHLVSSLEQLETQITDLNIAIAEIMGVM